MLCFMRLCIYDLHCQENDRTILLFWYFNQLFAFNLGLISSQLFDWMQQHGKTNSASYSSYIKFVGRGSNSMKAIEIYSSIKDETMRGNVSVCNSTLYCLIKSGKIESSFKLFNQMKRGCLVPDVVTYSTVCTLFSVQSVGIQVEKFCESHFHVYYSQPSLLLWIIYYSYNVCSSAAPLNL